MKDRNLEQQLADKLGNRSIAPGDQAWSRIAHNRQQAKSKGRRIFPYYAAAAVACLFAVGFVYLNLAESNNVITAPQVMHAEDATIANDTIEAINVENILPLPEAKAIVSQEITAHKGLEDGYHREVKSTSLASSSIEIQKNEQGISVAALPNVHTYTRDELNDKQATLLLDNAIKEVAADKYLAAPTSDTALLKEVETEMDAYYREKAMNIFSFKHKIIRIAVKDRQ